MAAFSHPLTDTTIEPRFRRYAADRARLGPPRGRRYWSLIALAALVIFAVTLAARLINLNGAHEIVVEEIIFLRVSESVAEHLRLAYFDTPFLPRPPLFFYLQGAYLKAIDPDGSIVDRVFVARYLNVWLAAATGVTLLLLGERLAGWRAGLLVAGVFALEPLVIRVNSRNLLETSAMLWALIGYLLIFSAPRWELSRLRIAGAGVAFGAALLTRESMAFVALAPLGVAWLFTWSMPRRASFATGATALSLYALYPLMVALTGNWGRFQDQKVAGLQRFVGARQEAAVTHGGFVEPSLLNLDQVATVYPLFALGAAAIVVLLLAGNQSWRLLGLLGAGSYAWQARGIWFGVNQERHVYAMAVAAIITTAVAASLALDWRWRGGGLQRWLRPALGALLVVFLAWSGHQWVVQRATPDNGHERLLAYMERHVPPGSRVAATTYAAYEILKEGPYTIGMWGTVAEMSENNVDYVVISTRLVERGYGAATPELFDWLTQRGELVYVFEGPSAGLLLLYAIPEQARQSAAWGSATRSAVSSRSPSRAMTSPGR